MRLYKRGNVWWVTYGSHPQIRVSTHRRDRTDAEEFAIRYVVPSVKEEAAELLERAARMKKSAAGERSLDVRLEDAFVLREYMQRNGTKESSARLAEGYWKRFSAFCNERGIHDIGGVTRKVCADFAASMPPRAAQCAVVYCRKILRECGCDRMLFLSVPKNRNARHHDPLTPEQVQMLLAHVQGLAEGKEGRFRERAVEFSWLVRFLLYTGLRLGDCATLTADMVDVKSFTIKRTMEKTGNAVEFPLHASLVPYVVMKCNQSMRQDGQQYIFPMMAASYHSGRQTISHAVKKALRSIGISGAAGQYCTHCLRTTFATLCAEHGVPMAVIQSWLGHSSPMVTRIYARIEDIKRKRDALERLPDFG